MSEQKPEYVVILDSNTISAGRRINALAAEGYEVVAQSSSSLPGQRSGWFTTWTLRLRPAVRQAQINRPLLAQLADNVLAVEERLAELETLTSQQKLQAVAENEYVSGLMVDLRALQTAEKDDRKAIRDNSGGLSVLEREVKHLRANVEVNIERTDRLLAIQKATEEMAQNDGKNEPESTRSLFAQINELDALAHRLESRLDHVWWTNAEINGMHCRVLVSARTEETGHE